MSVLNLPEDMMTLRSELGDVVGLIEEAAPYGAVILSKRGGLQIEVDNKQARVSELPPSAGTILRAYDGRTIYEQAVNGFNLDDVKRSVKPLVKGKVFEEFSGLNGEPERNLDFVTEKKIAPESLSIDEKLDRCRDIHKRAIALDERIVNVRLTYFEAGEQSVFRNRNVDLSQDVKRLLLRVVVYVKGDQGVRYDLLQKGTSAGWEALDFSNQELEQLVGNAIALLTAERIEPGEYTVVTSPAVAGTICHESFGHGVETDMFIKERAKAASYIDRQVGSELVNISDDPSLPGSFGSFFFDDEGFLTSPTAIVEDGIFRRGITDLYSATALGIPRSGNGRRQDYRRKVYARMSNTFFKSGSTPVEDLFAQVDDGIYLEKWNSGMEDPQGWGIQVTCHIAREIKKGKVTDRMFAPVVISGYVPEVLGSITAVGDEWALDVGTCGKGLKEYILTSAGGPHLLLKARLG